MEWVETTGKTVEEAKDAALDQLGVDEQEAEFEVLEEPRAGLFGRTRGEARVRARVQPVLPRPKVERRERRGRGDGRGPAAGGRGPRGRRAGGGSGSDERAEAPPTLATKPEPRAAAPSADGESTRPGRSRRTGARAARPARDDHNDEQGSRNMTEAELVEQGEVVRGFLVDLLDAFGLDGQVSATPTDDDAVELEVTGGDLGLLIGPKGGTLQAIQELSRSALQRQLPGDAHARIRVDVSGYRARRKVALAAFARQIAEEVRSSGVQKALEPMSPPDRKVVHDTVNDLAGVHTVSEGEDSRRRVVIIPDA